MQPNIHTLVKPTKRYNIFLGPYCKLRIFVFPLRFMARALHTWPINQKGKNSVCNLWYGPNSVSKRYISFIYLEFKGIYMFTYRLFMVKCIHIKGFKNEQFTKVSFIRNVL